MNAHEKPVARAWLRLLRLPNLLTVPGDVLAGFAVAWPVRTGGSTELLAATLAALLFYAAGLIMNDLADVERDRVERPQRPLPSGEVSRTAARRVTGILLGSALVMLGSQRLAMLAMGVALGGLIFVYNLWARRNRLAGVLVMGLCRAASVGLGVVAAAGGALVDPVALAVMMWWLLFVAAVSWLATREMEDGPYGPERWWPLLVILAGAACVMAIAEIDEPRMMFRGGMAFAFVALIAWQCAVRLRLKAARHHPPVIGWLISAMIPMQAGVLVLFAREPWMLLAALVVLFAWPLNRWLAKSWAAS